MTTSEDIDISTTAGKLAELRRRQAEGPEALAAAAVEKQGKRGKKTADRKSVV